MQFDNGENSTKMSAKISNGTQESLPRAESELDLLNSSKCIPDESTHLINHLASLDTRALKDLLLSQFLNYQLLQIISCLFDGLDYDQTLIKRWLNLEQIIGAPSVYGEAISGGIDASNEFIFKISKGKEKESMIIHEASVGKVGTNTLRKYTPIFSYVMGLIKCGMPLTVDKQVASFCSKTAIPRTFIVYEYIPGDTWHKHLKKWTVREFMSSFLILLSGLRIANKKINFTHYDLHYDNIICRPVTFGSQPVTFNDTTWYVETNLIPTIIDYGFSHYYNYGLTQARNGIYNQMRPLYDVHRILATSHYAMKYENVNLPLQQLLSNMLAYFNIQGNFLTNDTALGSIDDYFKWLKYLFPHYLPLLPSYTLPIIGCGSTVACSTTNKILDRLGLNMDIFPQSLLDVKDVNFIINNPNYVLVLLKNYQIIFDHELGELNDLRELIDTHSTLENKLFHLVMAYDLLTKIIDNFNTVRTLRPQLSIISNEYLSFEEMAIKNINLSIYNMNLRRDKLVSMANSKPTPQIVEYLNILVSPLNYLET